MKKKSIIIILIIIMIINTLMPITAQATGNNNGIFDENITFSTEYFEAGESQEGLMAYGVLTPSTAKSSDSVPLIVWIHGDSEVGCRGDKFMGIGSYSNLSISENMFSRVIRDSRLEKFNAYVLCPHATNPDLKWIEYDWVKPVSTLIDYFVKQKGNVDTNNIVIVGFSGGSTGATRMVVNTDQMPYNFSKLVVMSGSAWTGYENINIPTRGYAGKSDFNNRVTRHVINNISTAEPFIEVDSDHMGTPKAAYNLDKDGNGCSDLIEWMFEGYKISTDVSDDDSIEETDDMDEAGDLFVDLAQLLCFVPDIVIETLQHMFVSDKNIYDETTEEYKILYSPGTIFSGNIPAFDINFIKPNTYTSRNNSNEYSIIASNTYSANRSGGVSSSGSNVIYEGESIIGATTTHTKGERWNSRNRRKIIRNIWIQYCN